MPFGCCAAVKRDKPAFAVPEQPDAFGFGAVADGLRPGVRVGGIIAERHRIAVLHRALLPNMPRLSMRTLETPCSASASASSR